MRSCVKRSTWFSHRYIKFVKVPDGQTLRSNHEMCRAFWAHFHDHFARCPHLPVQEFCSNLTDFTRLQEVEEASCKGLVTEGEVHEGLKQVSLNKSLRLDGLPYQVYLEMLHMFVPILTDIFNHWFAQGAIPGSITKGVITLLKKGGRHVWEDLDNYRPITLLNTELKILAQVLANRLQFVISDLRCPWCSRYCRRKWTRRHEFKSWTRLIAFHIALIPLGKV